MAPNKRLSDAAANSCAPQRTNRTVRKRCWQDRSLPCPELSCSEKSMKGVKGRVRRAGPALVNRAQAVSAFRLRSSRSFCVARRRHSREGPAALRRRYHCPSRGCLVNRSRNCTRCRVPPFRRRYHCPESGCHPSRLRFASAGPLPDRTREQHSLMLAGK